MDELDRHAAAHRPRAAPGPSSCVARSAPAATANSGRTRLPPATIRWLATSVRNGSSAWTAASSSLLDPAEVAGHATAARSSGLGGHRARTLGGQPRSRAETVVTIATAIAAVASIAADGADWRTWDPGATGRLAPRIPRLREADLLFERFTDRARRVVVLAQEEARLLNHNYIGTEHILLGLIHEGEGVAAKALESLGISLEAVRSQVEEIIGQGGSSPCGHIPFTPARQEGPRAVAARGAAARPQLHRHRAHPARPHP